jgi:hypothetical protein
MGAGMLGGETITAPGHVRLFTARKLARTKVCAISHRLPYMARTPPSDTAVRMDGIHTREYARMACRTTLSLVNNGHD